MNKIIDYLLLGLLFLSPNLFAEKKEFKFGKVEIADLESAICPVDSGASAYVIGNYGLTSFEYDNEKGFQVIFEHHFRIKILKKNAFNYGDQSIALYHTGRNEETVSDLKANTYNLENGQIVISKLDKKSTFKEEVDLHRNNLKFSMPNVKEGSIIEISYKIYSDFLQIQDWVFQKRIPVLYSRYKLVIPEYFFYKVFQNGYLPIQTNKDVEATSFTYKWSDVDAVGMKIPNSTHMEKIDYLANISIYTGENISAFKEEPYMRSSTNYISSIEFELQSTHYPYSLVKYYSRDWKSIAKELLDYDYFGDIIKSQNPTNNIVNAATKGVSDPLQKAVLIYEYIRNQFKWNGLNRLYATKSTRKIIEEKSGNSADINLTLIAALKNAGLKAEPVVLSTRDNGIILVDYPVISKLNYVIAVVFIDDKKILLDATDSYAPFGFLPEKCLNGEGRIISEENSGNIELISKSNYYHLINTVLSISEDGTLKGNWLEINKGYAANEFRKKFGKAKSKEDFIQEIQRNNPGLTIDSCEIQNMDSLSKEINIKYDVSIEGKTETIGNLLMIKPLLFEQLDENMFKSEERKFPVD